MDLKKDMLYTAKNVVASEYFHNNTINNKRQFIKYIEMVVYDNQVTISNQ